MASEDCMSEEYVAELLKKDAQESSKKYSKYGIDALLPKRPSIRAPRANTKFLSNLIRDTNLHNATLKAKEEEEAARRLSGTKSPRGESLGNGQFSRGDDERSTKRRRIEDNDHETSRRRNRHGDRHASRRSRSPKSDRHDRRRSRERSRDRERRHRRRRDKSSGSEEHSNYRHTKERDHRHRRDRSRTRSRSPDRERRQLRHRDHSNSEERPRERRHRDSEKRDRKGKSSPLDLAKAIDEARRRRNRKPRSKSRSRSRSKDRKSRRQESDIPSSAASRTVPKAVSGEPKNIYYPKKQASDSASDSDSDPLEAIIGPPPPPSPPPVRRRGRGARNGTSGMDARFSSNYDPNMDVEPNSDAEADWEMAVESMRDRMKWRQQGADRLRAAGFSEKEVKTWEKGREKTEEDVKWNLNGEGREWDRGKVVDADEGPLMGAGAGGGPEFGRLKGW